MSNLINYRMILFTPVYNSISYTIIFYSFIHLNMSGTQQYKDDPSYFHPLTPTSD